MEEGPFQDLRRGHFRGRQQGRWSVQMLASDQSVGGKGTHDLEVPVDDVQFVHVFHTACYFQQLTSEH